MGGQPSCGRTQPASMPAATPAAPHPTPLACASHRLCAPLSRRGTAAAALPLPSAGAAASAGEAKASRCTSSATTGSRQATSLGKKRSTVL